MGEVLIKEENIIDLGSIISPENFLFELTTIIEKRALQGKNIKVNFGEAVISEDYLTSIISVLKGYQTEIEMIYAEATETKLAAINVGLTVSGQKFEPAEESAAVQSEEQDLESFLSNDSQEEDKNTTLYLKQTLRSGQKVEHDGNIVIIGDCNAGSEIISTGDIVVWGILSGIAHAGSEGNAKACIRAFKINAIQLRIADYLARKPDQLILEKSEKSDYFNPEEAKISEGEIVIYSLYQAYD